MKMKKIITKKVFWFEFADNFLTSGITSLEQSQLRLSMDGLFKVSGSGNMCPSLLQCPASILGFAHNSQ